MRPPIGLALLILGSAGLFGLLAAGLALVALGMAWIAVVPALNTLVALLAPPSVRGRPLSVWFLGYNGGLAIGSVLAEASLTAALLVPAAGAFAGRVWPLAHDL